MLRDRTGHRFDYLKQQILSLLRPELGRLLNGRKSPRLRKICLSASDPLRTLLKTIKVDKLRAVLRQNSKARAMFLRAFAAVSISIILSICSLQIQPSTSEKAEYGNMGSAAENWQPRLVAGWPAPFIADIPTISVPRQIGLEDEFRSSAFFATFSFWLLMTSMIIVTFCSFRRR